MKIKIMYDTMALLEILADTGYDFIKLPVKEEWEDDCRECYGYYFTKPEVTGIDYWHSMGTSAVIHFSDGHGVQALGSYVISNKKDWIELNNNEFISPQLKYNGKYVESTEALESWLLKHGVSQEELENCSHEETFYETITYEGVPTPRMHYGNWGYSSEDLVLDEREIEAVLQSVDDIVLRKKIECILYARVFKRQRY